MDDQGTSNILHRHSPFVITTPMNSGIKLQTWCQNNVIIRNKEFVIISNAKMR